MTLNIVAPAIVHAADLALVTFAQPGQSGEILTLYVWDLAPELSEDPARLSAGLPERVPVVGVKASVIYAGHYSGGDDGNQIDLRVPITGKNPGRAELRIDSGFLPGDTVMLPIGAGK